MPSSTSSRPAQPNRTGQGSGDGREPAEAGRRRAFRRGVLTGALVIVVAGGVTAGAVLLRPPTTAESIRATADKIRAQDAARNKREVRELTGTARGIVTQLTPVVQQMYKAMPPPEGGRQQPATQKEVAGWRHVTAAVLKILGSPPSGDTSYNVARTGFTQASHALDDAAATYALRFGAPPRLAGDLAARAASELNTALVVWSVGATELDVANIDAGYGHQHVFLSAFGDDGALTSDGAPEGSESRP